MNHPYLILNNPDPVSGCKKWTGFHEVKLNSHSIAAIFGEKPVLLASIKHYDVIRGSLGS